MVSQKIDKAQKFWSSQIGKAKEREANFRQDGKRIVDRYRSGKCDEGGVPYPQFNMLWSNTEILKGATLSRVPQPNVTRRYKTDGGVIRKAAEVYERALEYYSDIETFMDSLRCGRDDMLLPGRRS
jgi:hypothetical protein